MVDFTFFSNSENLFLEEKYLTFEEVGLPDPNGGAAGALWATGIGDLGQLGDGTRVNKSSPVQIGLLSDWKMISSSGSFHAAATKTDGTLWAWGFNGNGQLGQGNRTGRSSPIQIGSLNDWQTISSGAEAISAIKNDGTLWMWGQNAHGELGQNDTVHRSSPVQVGSLTDWKIISMRHKTALAIKTDGTLWAWGQNSRGFDAALDISGTVGDGTRTHRSSPVQIGALTDWKSVTNSESISAAIKTDGTLWTWGWNAQGQLGQNNLVHRSSPTQVGGLTNWREVSGGGNFILAIKTDNTLWAWGDNIDGQLGDGTTVDKSSPIQIGLLTNWKTVDAGKLYAASALTGHNMAIKTDGTLWAWGRNSNTNNLSGGQLGDGTRTHRSSPIQIGSLTNWKSCAVGAQTSYAKSTVY